MTKVSFWSFADREIQRKEVQTRDMRNHDNNPDRWSHRTHGNRLEFHLLAHWRSQRSMEWELAIYKIMKRSGPSNHRDHGLLIRHDEGL
jgi:hypothetical protein